ncbi:TIGR04219 family outer membrane beta-barrel protein [Acinetobacter towneri]|uniref:TIGR04219 family outer membrane beta-barrel protein n=1 Tax=Acinetobacter towneri TaxID=202956 RepID=UPI002DB6759F|nr:TIGR04219 family outer membrane beta-barrel protein [Acinetobacter towneri]MEB6566230.1 TIGR04219 family outer membrane beta-barrel protein [Acinetobacter towneri]
MITIPRIALALSLAGCSLAHADIIGVKASLDYWKYSADWTQTQLAPELDDDYALPFSVSVEHPVPFLPNAKIKHTNLQAESEQSVAGVKTHQLDLDYSDFILYYEILDNIVAADVGIGAKLIEGDLKSNLFQTQEVSETLPMLYAEAAVKLPFTGLSAKAEANYAKNSDNEVRDAQAEIKYNFIDAILVDVGLKAGYRILDIKLDQDSNQETQLEFKGPYLGLEAHF